MKRDPEHIYQQVSKGTLPAGIEYWQPLFFNEPLPPLFSYFLQYADCEYRRSGAQRRAFPE